MHRSFIAVLVLLGAVALGAPAAACAEATLTEVVEAEQAVKAEVAATKTATEAGTAKTAEVLTAVGEVKAEVAHTLPPLEKADELLGGTLKISCTSGCTGGGGGEFELTPTARTTVEGSGHKAAVLVAGVLCALAIFALIAIVLNPRRGS